MGLYSGGLIIGRIYLSLRFAEGGGGGGGGGKRAVLIFGRTDFWRGLLSEFYGICQIGR